MTATPLAQDDDTDTVDLGDDSTYIDEIAVERRCAGDRTVTLNRTEAAEAVARLERAGLSASEISDRLGITARTVVRWRGGEYAPITLRGVAMTSPAPAPSPVGRLLEDASGHADSRVRRLAERIEKHLDDLRALIAASAEQDKVRAEVTRLEAELARAKAALRRKPQGTPPPHSQQPRSCRAALPQRLRPHVTDIPRPRRPRTALRGHR